MLSKILKYDCRALYKSLLPMMLASVGSAFIAFALSEWQSSLSQHDQLLPMIVLSGVSFFFTLAVYAMFAVEIVMILFRYYKSMFTDEGYLTFVTPASTSRIFTGKFISGSLWAALAAVVLVASVFITDLIYNLENDTNFFGSLSDVLSLLGVESWLVTANSVSSILLYWVMLYTGINIGSVLFMKHKVLGSLLFIFALSTASNTVSSVLSFLLLMAERDLSNLYYIISTVLSLLLAAGMYLLSLSVLKKKLNLE